MRLDDDPPDWRLPKGVNRPLWAYARSDRLAEEEDSYFGNHALFAADTKALDARFQKPGKLIDLGSGAGRLSIHFAGARFAVIAVDLSQPMLRVVGRKATRAGLEVGLLQANLCRLGCLPADHFDYAISMFSTLGMIRGKAARKQALDEAFRILKPGGRLALHAHNFWLNLRDPQGIGWLISQGWKRLFSPQEIGDRQMTYRGIPGMQVHLYRWPELRSELIESGFSIEESLPIDPVDARLIPLPGLFPSIRAGGWLVFADKP